MIDIETIQITSEMLNLIAEIDEFKGSWQLLSRISPDRLSSLKKVATIESIGSSTRIEGAKLSDKEVEALLSQVNRGSFESRDEQEVGSYALACEKIIENFDAIPITENGIKQIHSWLLSYSEKDERHRGEYKTIPIKIEAFDNQGKHIGIIFETTSPLETPIKMQELVKWVQDTLRVKNLHPLIVIGIFIVIFLAIHPFQDGNGRLSRLLTTLIMMKCGYSYVSYSSLESIIEANKESYYLSLQRTQKSWQNHKPDWMPWLLFFLRSLQRQKRHLEQKIFRESSIMKELSPLSKNIIELLQAHGKLNIREIEILTNANRNTLKRTLSQLVKNKHIAMHGKGKATWYHML